MAAATTSKELDLTPKLGDQLVFEAFAPPSNDNVLFGLPLDAGTIAQSVYFTVGDFVDDGVTVELLAALDTSEGDAAAEAAAFSSCVMFVAGDAGGDA